MRRERGTPPPAGPATSRATRASVAAKEDAANFGGRGRHSGQDLPVLQLRVLGSRKLNDESLTTTALASLRCLESADRNFVAEQPPDVLSLFRGLRRLVGLRRFEGGWQPANQAREARCVARVDGEGDEEGGGASGRRFCCPDALARGRRESSDEEVPAQERAQPGVVGLLACSDSPGNRPRGSAPDSGIGKVGRASCFDWVPGAGSSCSAVARASSTSMSWATSSRSTKASTTHDLERRFGSEDPRPVRKNQDTAITRTAQSQMRHAD